MHQRPRRTGRVTFKVAPLDPRTHLRETETILIPNSAHYTPARLAAAAALVLATSGTSLAQETASAEFELREMTALRLADGDEVGLDGVLDEAFWSRAVPATDFIQIDPDNGQPATEETAVRIVYTREALYIGVRAFDSEPDRWLGYQRRRDEFLGSDDRFMWTIDTFLDGRSGYFFEMNPAGLMADALLGVNGQNRQWDGIWNARHNHDNLGWTLEIEIPFRTLNFDPDNDTWGINFQRTVRRKNEDSIWMGWARNQGLRRMTNAGRVTGISEVTQGNGLDIKPYGVFTSQKIGDLAVSNDGNAGLDIFYNPTPGMRATVTFNTDFAQTEVDDRQVNLTQFSLFFPEKRDFFLDGAPFFDFGSPQNGLRVNPFFSRRVGLNADGTAQKIDFGTKVTGQMGLQDVGVLHVRTENEDGVIGEDFTVARAKRRILSQSYVGALYTRRDSRVAGEDALHTVGADLRLATSTFLGSQNLEATGWWLTATTGDAAVTNDRAAFGATISYPNDRWSGGLDLREVQENFAPSLGFVTRAGYRRYMPNVQFAPRPNAHPYIRQFTFSTTVDVQTDMANDLLKREVSARLFGVSMHSQESFSFDTTQTRERLDRPFRIARRFELPVGSVYDYTRFQVNFQTANRRVLALSGRYGWGNFFSGTRNETVLNLTLRARPGYIVYLTGEWNRIEVPEGTVATRLYRLVGETQFTPFVALVNTFQYDTVSRVLGWQSRFRWIITPGSDLYLVYTHNWEDDPTLARFQTLERRLASKVLYTYRF